MHRADLDSPSARATSVTISAFAVSGPEPDQPGGGLAEGPFLPATAVLASFIGYVFNASPIWFAAASFGLFVAVLGLRRSPEGSRWFHF